MSGPDTPELAEAAVEGGADLVELGFPFSDPLADGPVVRRAAEKALAQGMRTRACLECLAAVRERVEVPLVPMTYSSLLEAYGWERFAEDARSAGAASLIVADLPAGDRPGLRRVQLVAPTSTDERLRLAGAHTDGWLYLVTVTGTTGARTGLSASLAQLAERARSRHRRAALRRLRDLDAGDARAAAELTDGVVVGSQALEAAEAGPRRCGHTSARCGTRSTRTWDLPRIGYRPDPPPGTAATPFRGFSRRQLSSTLATSSCAGVHMLTQPPRGTHHGKDRAAGSVEARQDRSLLGRVRNRRDRADRRVRSRLVVRCHEAGRRLVVEQDRAESRLVVEQARAEGRLVVGRIAPKADWSSRYKASALR